MTNCRPFAAILVCLLFAPTAWAQAFTFGDVKISRYSEPQGATTHGYTDYRFLVQNESKDTTHEVRLGLPGDDRPGRGGYIQEVSRFAKVEPGKSVLVSVLVPAEPVAYGNGVNVWIDGRKQNDRVSLTVSAGGRSHRHGMGLGSEQLILYSQRVPEQFFTPVRAGLGGMGGMHGGGMGIGPGGGLVVPAPKGKGVKFAPEDKFDPDNPAAIARVAYTLNGAQVRADSPVSAWSRHWLAFSRYDGIVLTSDDMTELGRGGNETEPVVRSLLQYVETGGVLIVLGKGKLDVPASWRRHVFDRDGATVYAAGFGRCIVMPDANSAKWTADRWSNFNDCQRTAQPFGDNRPLGDLNRTLAPVDDLGVPVRGLFLLMCAFAVGIGPANVWLLSRWQRRIWLLWTVPAMSMLTCAAVFGYMVIAEGWQGHARVTGLTVLDETEKRATSIGRTSFYTPLTPRDGLRFEADTEVTVIGARSMDRRYGMEESTLGPCTVHWGEGGQQHLARGWVSARVPAHFLLRKSQTDQRRVIVVREGDSLMLTNALGKDDGSGRISGRIKSIKLIDENGDLYEGEDVAVGAKTELRRVERKADEAPRKAKADPGALRTQVYLSMDWAGLVKAANDRSDLLLGPRTYLAVVEGSPFLEQALKGAKERETESVVLGLMADLK